ncbi:MAG: hypothetical protein ACRDJS_04045 [Actinomycetota bacterium]
MKKLISLSALLLLLATACAGDELGGSPKESLSAAIENLTELQGLEMVFTVQSTADSIAALDESEENALSEEDAQRILDSSISVKTRGKTPEEAQAEFVVNIAGEDDIEMRFLDQTLYVRADVRGLIETFGGDPSGLDQFEQQASAAGVTFVKPAIEGEWIGLEGLKELAQQQGFPTARAPDQDALVRAFRTAVDEEAEVTEGDRDGPGTHLVVDLPVREIYERLLPEFQKLLVGVPGAALPPASEVPDESVRVDTWVDGDQLKQVRLDLLQFFRFGDEPVPEGVEEFALQVTIDEFDDEVEAPEDAVTLTPQEIQQAFGALMGGAITGTESQSGTATPGVDCEVLEQAPPEVQQQFVKECPVN